MGTRNLTMVVKDNKTKVAQYCQWDGYPGGQGLDILSFLTSNDIESFKQSVDKVRWITKSEVEKAEKDPN